MKKLKTDEKLFIRQCLRNIKGMGAIVPSSPVLARAMAHFTDYKSGQIVVELGAGTGALTAGLLRSGVPPESLYSVEVDSQMVEVLSRKYSSVHIYQGDAAELSNILPDSIIGKVDTIVSGLPLFNFSKKEREKIIESSLNILGDTGKILQFTYGFISPIPYKKLGLKGRRVDYVVKNIPPAFIWEFSKN